MTYEIKPDGMIVIRRDDGVVFWMTIDELSKEIQNTKRWLQTLDEIWSRAVTDAAVQEVL